MESAHLKDRAVIALEGGQAREFLQGLVTNDVALLEPGKGLYAALLTPQGKILFDFLIAEGDGALLLDCAAASAGALVKRLNMYRLRARIEIALKPQLSVYAGLERRPAERAISFADPRLAALPRRSIGAAAEMPDFLEGSAPYHTERLKLGIPEGADFGSDKVFALDAGLEELHGVSFGKGCYVGQELTARMKHRGTAKKRILSVRAEGALPRPGAKITSGASELGEILSTYGAHGFALVRLDRLPEGGGPLVAEDVPVTLEKPPWLSP
ncbi:MAG: YgfZ/GcvT domain-containing protein [Rhizomicrobium sp.]